MTHYIIFLGGGDTVVPFHYKVFPIFRNSNYLSRTKFIEKNNSIVSLHLLYMKYVLEFPFKVVHANIFLYKFK